MVRRVRGLPPFANQTALEQRLRHRQPRATTSTAPLTPQFENVAADAAQADTVAALHAQLVAGWRAALPPAVAPPPPAVVAAVAAA